MAFQPMIGNPLGALAPADAPVKPRASIAITPAMIDVGLRVYSEWESQYICGEAMAASEYAIEELVIRLFRAMIER